MSFSSMLGFLFRSASTSVVLDLVDSGLPSVTHWGADIGPLDPSTLRALVVGGVETPGNSAVDQAVRVSLLPEAANGWLGKPGLSGSHAGKNWSPQWSVFDIQFNGSPIAVPEGSATSPTVEVHTAEAGTLTASARDALGVLELVLVVEVSVEGVIRTRALLRNLSSDPYQLEELTVSYPIPSAAGEVLDFAGRWAHERTPQRRPITVGTHRREGRTGRTGLGAATLLIAGEPHFGFRTGETWSLHTAWSGNHIHQVEKVFSGVQLLSGGELLLPGEINLAQGETYESPWVYGVYGAGLDDAANRLHRDLRSRPQHPKSDRPMTLNVWEAVYFAHDLATLTELADVAATIGIERFVLDDGWFGSRRDDTSGLGDWVVSPEVWPTGLTPLISHVKSLGMKFGLWFEPEMVNLDSDLARSHPEWIMATGAQLPPESRHQQVLNIGIPECYAYIRDAMCAVLDAHDVDYIKWDHNRDLVDAGTLPTGTPGVHEQTEAYYRLLQELKERYPGLEIESCASGGGRVDLGAIQLTDRVWGSDNSDPIDRQSINRWTTQLLPPELIGAHIASKTNHITGRSHSLAFRAITALFNHLGVEWDLRKVSSEAIEELTFWINLYKEHRNLLHGGTVVRIDLPDPALSCNGVVAVDKSDALFSYVTLANSDIWSPGRIRFPGLDTEALYSVEAILTASMKDAVRPTPWMGEDSLVLSGAALMRAGLVAPIMRPEAAALFHLKRV